MSELPDNPETRQVVAAMEAINKQLRSTDRLQGAAYNRVFSAIAHLQSQLGECRTTLASVAADRDKHLEAANVRERLLAECRKVVAAKDEASSRAFNHEESYRRLIENAAATAKERQARELAEGENKWRDGTPDVPEGKQRSFLVSCNGGKYVGVLLYSNKFWAPCSDDVEPPAGAESNDDGDFCWNGWCEESCDQCDTFWSWGGTVDGWMPLPSAKLAPAPAGGKPE
jgi:hypothetical protein